MGGTGLEPVTPSLSTWRRRSRQFAPVRLHGFVERNHLFERTPERTRTNTEPCHPCHASLRARRYASAAAASSCSRIAASRGGPVRVLRKARARRPVSLDREVAGLFDFGGASAEDQCPHSGAVQLDRGVRLAVWGGMDLPCNDFDSDGFLSHANLVLAACLARIRRAAEEERGERDPRRDLGRVGGKPEPVGSPLAEFAEYRAECLTGLG